MTCLEYIRQLPGCEYKNAFNLTCPHAFGLEEVCPNDIGECGQCWQNEATIDGNPAPYLYACPVKPGQTVYQVNDTDGTIHECKISYIFFTERCWAADCTSTIGFEADAWGELIFPTREDAEKKLEELKS